MADRDRARHARHPLCPPPPLPSRQVSFGWTGPADRRRCLALLRAVAAAMAAGGGEGGGGGGSGAMLRGADAAVFPLPPHVAGRLIRAAADRIRARVADAEADADADADAGGVEVGAGAEDPVELEGPARPEHGRVAVATIGPAVAGAGRRVLTVGYLRCAPGVRLGTV